MGKYFDYADPHKQGHPETHNMSPERLERLKEVLSIPSHYHEETLATKYIVEFCEKHGFEHIVDNLGSVLITKGVPPTADGFYPLISAHIDTVHPLVKKNIREDRNILTAWDNDGNQLGIGGDDLAGLHIAIELLLIMPVLKVGLFVSEEIGCVGSRNAVRQNREWFNDVGYLISWDGPEDHMLTMVCSGEILFDENGEFIQKSLPLFQESMGEKMKFYSHPFTDACILKRAFTFSCINVSAGYFAYHSSREYVVISEVEKAIILGEKLINTLGYQRYDFIQPEKYNYGGARPNNIQQLWG